VGKYDYLSKTRQHFVVILAKNMHILVSLGNAFLEAKKPECSLVGNKYSA
jgi:hypothetical protein